jgi:hypothetical protein
LGFFEFVAMQEPQAQYFESGARNNFGFRLLLGRAKSVSHYTMMFGDAEKDWMSQEEDVRCWGYLYIDPNDPVMFFSPNITSGFNFMDFFDEIGEKYPAQPLLSAENLLDKLRSFGGEASKEFEPVEKASRSNFDW